MKILIGGAWKYTDGSLHIGHLAALLPGDVLARYHRAKGNCVYYVSGSDCHGTPVAIRARQENRTPREVSDFYHEEFTEVYRRLGFSYDYYGKTSSEEHRAFVEAFHKRMYVSPYIYEKTAPRAWCAHCGTFLADRFVTGTCPRCGAAARGDQCDACTAVLEPETLLAPRCAVCAETPEFRESRHLYIALSKLAPQLSAYIRSHPEWRKNALAFSNRYLDEGLRDRAVTRDLDWGIDVPRKGYEDKKIYIWAENVLGYLSASAEVCRLRGESFEELWSGEARHYYVHGKDNIPFHTIILPALLLAHGQGLRLPDDIISSEYLTLEGRRISTSGNWAIWAKDIIDRYEPDSLRYFFLANGPEKRDTDFSWREYVNSHNGELLGAYGNFINRTLVFIGKYFGGIVPEGTLEPKLRQSIGELYETVGVKIEEGACKEALELIFGFVRSANRYYDAQEPWKTRESAFESCQNTLFNCVQLAANLAVLLKPFLPFTSDKLLEALLLRDEWKPHSVPAGQTLAQPGLLFKRLDRGIVEEELARLR